MCAREWKNWAVVKVCVLTWEAAVDDSTGRKSAQCTVGNVLQKMQGVVGGCRLTSVSVSFRLAHHGEVEVLRRAASWEHVVLMLLVLLVFVEHPRVRLLSHRIEGLEDQV